MKHTHIILFMIFHFIVESPIFSKNPQEIYSDEHGEILNHQFSAAKSSKGFSNGRFEMNLGIGLVGFQESLLKIELAEIKTSKHFGVTTIRISRTSSDQDDIFKMSDDPLYDNDDWKITSNTKDVTTLDFFSLNFYQGLFNSKIIYVEGYTSLTLLSMSRSINWREYTRLDGLYAEELREENDYKYTPSLCFGLKVMLFPIPLQGGDLYFISSDFGYALAGKEHAMNHSKLKGVYFTINFCVGLNQY